MVCLVSAVCSGAGWGGSGECRAPHGFSLTWFELPPLLWVGLVTQGGLEESNVRQAYFPIPILTTSLSSTALSEPYQLPRVPLQNVSGQEKTNVPVSAPRIAAPCRPTSSVFSLVTLRSISCCHYMVSVGQLPTN